MSAAKAIGLAARAFDKDRIRGVTDTADPNTTEDILLEAGFRRALSLVLQIRQGGLVWMAPVCSSWVFLNLRNTKRTSTGGPKYMGNILYLPVRHGNLMADMAAFLFAVAVLNGAHAVIENPAGSMIFNYEVAATAWEAVWPKRFWAVLPHCRFSTAPYGSRVLKKFKLMGSHQSVEQLACKCRCPGRKHRPLATTKVVNGKRTVTGCKQALKDSAAYPAKMGIAIINAWIHSSQTVELHGPRSHGWKVPAQHGPRCPGPSRRKPQNQNQKLTRTPISRCGCNTPTTRSWVSLPVEKNLASTSSCSCQSLAHWRHLNLEDGADPAVIQGPGQWQALTLEDPTDLPMSHEVKSWKRLSLDDV